MPFEESQEDRSPYFFGVALATFTVIVTAGTLGRTKRV
jgi:hypothetical protein